VAQTKTAASTKSKAAKSAAKGAAAPKAAAPKAAAKPAAKKAPAKAAAKTTKKPAGKAKAGEAEVSLDRRRVAERRDEVAAVVAPAAEKQPVAKPAGLERREKVSRRRQIDPTTCERDYSDSEVEFMNALDAYKRRSGRMFPTCSEVLEVIHEIGYVRLTPAEAAMLKAGRGEVDQTVEDLTVEDRAENEAREALAESEALRAE
jgi:hypothetical protein